MKKITLPILGAIALLSLTGCSTSFDSLIPVPPPAAAAQPAEKPAPVEVKPLKTDLAEGALVHEVPVGAGSILFDYWTDTVPSEWKDGDIVPVNVSLKTSGSGEMVYSATSVAAWTQDEELYHDEGDYTLTPPFSYFTTLLIPVSELGTDLTVRADIIIETFKDSGEYVKVSVADTLQLVYAESDTVDEK